MSLRLSRIDLNLLVALQVLLLERNVTRAAERLCVTPSAMSKTLTRLREMFADELLVRSKKCLVLTPLADSLVEPLNVVLANADKLVFPDPIDSRELSGLIRLGIPEPASAMVVPGLVARIKQQAPNVILQTHNLLDDYQQQLSEGLLDFCVYPERNVYDLVAQPVGTVRLSCMMRAGHPLAGKGALTDQAFLNVKKIFYFVPDVSRHWLTVYQEELRKGQQHLLVFETSQLFAAVEAILQTDAIMLTAEGMGKCLLCRDKVVERPIPANSHWSTERMNLYLITHPRTQNSPLHTWVGQQIQAAVNEVMPFGKYK